MKIWRCKKGGVCRIDRLARLSWLDLRLRQFGHAGHTIVTIFHLKLVWAEWAITARLCKGAGRVAREPWMNRIHGWKGFFPWIIARARGPCHSSHGGRFTTGALIPWCTHWWNLFIPWSRASVAWVLYIVFDSCNPRIRIIDRNKYP